MKKHIAILLFGILFLFASCQDTKHKKLFDGTSLKNWQVENKVELKDKAMVLEGKNAEVSLKGGKYKDFLLTLKMRTVNKGKGQLSFHSSDQGKGYSIAINNDLDDKVWWRMTGSLMSVRNLAKSLVKDGEWFDMNILVEGQSVFVLLNGQPVVEYVEPKEPMRLAPNEKSLLSEGTFKILSTGEGSIEIQNISLTVIDHKEKAGKAKYAGARDEGNDPILALHQEDFPVLDFHVHLKGGLTKEAAAIQSRKLGINYAIAPNCGIGFPITTDEEVYSYIDTMRSEPFILAMQGEGREWVTTFSQEARDQFDYVFTDALTFTDHKGRRTRLWVVNNKWIDNEQRYMDLIVDRTCEVLKEPVDVFVNPCYLPDKMSDRYDAFWTEKRMDKFVDALAKSGKALEINELYNIPNKAIIMKAKAAGVKFTFGSNNVTPNVSNLEYGIKMKKECGLTAADMYKPKIKI